MWWWDLLIKRADIALMMLIAYTSMIEDDTAKLFVFAFISGILLCLTTWFKPYSNNQAEILDIMETCLLTTRFVLYFVVAMLLIIFPSPTTVRLCALFVLVMLISVCAFAVLHIIAQALRQEQKQSLANEDSDDDEEEDVQETFSMFLFLTSIVRFFVITEGSPESDKVRTFSLIMNIAVAGQHKCIYSSGGYTTLPSRWTE